MNNNKKPKEWFEENERLNKDHILKVGDRLYHEGFSWQKTDEPWIVVSIREGYTRDDPGSIIIKREAGPFMDYDSTSDYDEYNPNYEDYCYYNWKRYFRIIKEKLYLNVDN